MTAPATSADGTMDEVQITREMEEAGENAILGEVGGADLGGHFDARELAAEVYRAMHIAGRLTKSHIAPCRS
jgi:hypothetical protein